MSAKEVAQFVVATALAVAITEPLSYRLYQASYYHFEAVYDGTSRQHFVLPTLLPQAVQFYSKQPFVVKIRAEIPTLPFWLETSRFRSIFSRFL